MEHAIYTGVTQSGKTTLARHASRTLLSHKAKVAVYDPMLTDTLGGGWGEGALIFNDPESFLDWVHSDESNHHIIFVDEAHHIFSHEQKEHLWMLTQGRHYGMYFNLITQRPKKIHPDARTNCPRCYVFRLAQDDVKDIAADYGFSNLHRISLDRGDFLALNAGSAEFSRANVFQLLQRKQS